MAPSMHVYSYNRTPQSGHAFPTRSFSYFPIILAGVLQPKAVSGVSVTPRSWQKEALRSCALHRFDGNVLLPDVGCSTAVHPLPHDPHGPSTVIDGPSVDRLWTVRGPSFGSVKRIGFGATSVWTNRHRGQWTLRTRAQPSDRRQPWT